VNDADFEMLRERTDAADSVTGEVDTKLRVLALDYAAKVAHIDSDVPELAQRFYEFLKGESSENLRRQDER
jgi:hypothetical protein